MISLNLFFFFRALTDIRPNDIKKKKRRKSAGALDVAGMLRKFEREKARRQQQVHVEAAADAAGGGSDPLISLIGSTNDHALIQAANTVDFDIDLESLLSVTEAASTPKSLPHFVPDSKVQPRPDSVPLHSKTVSASLQPGVPPLEGIPAGLNDAIQKLNLVSGLSTLFVGVAASTGVELALHLDYFRLLVL